MDDPVGAPAFLRVLASGSGGNCSVLLPQADPTGGFWLIDAGLSPRRTRKLLADASLSLDGVRGVLITHLDSDHWNPVWNDTLVGRTRVLFHEEHLDAGRLGGLIGQGAASYSGTLELAPGVRVHTMLAAHDQTGSAAFRVEFEAGAARATLGYATDVGRADAALVRHLHGVDVLAIESNYCPRLQATSGRPWFLRQRITSGAGHLSNGESAAAVRAIRPRSHVVLLHLSRQCNRPDLARAEHRHGPCPVTIASQHESTGWIPIAPGPACRIPEIEAPLFAGLSGAREGGS